MPFADTDESQPLYSHAVSAAENLVILGFADGSMQCRDLRMWERLPISGTTHAGGAIGDIYLLPRKFCEHAVPFVTFGSPRCAPAPSPPAHAPAHALPLPPPQRHQLADAQRCERGRGGRAPAVRRARRPALAGPPLTRRPAGHSACQAFVASDARVGDLPPMVNGCMFGDYLVTADSNGRVQMYDPTELLRC